MVTLPAWPSIARGRNAFADAGAWITDVRFFSGVQTVLTFEAPCDRLAALTRALAAAGVVLDDASSAALAEASAAPGEAQGTLALIFREGDPDLKHDIPAVPG